MGTWRCWGVLMGRVSLIEGSKLTVFDPQKLGVWLFGFAEAGVLTYLKARVSWWPFHPAAIALPVGRYGFCLLSVVDEDLCHPVWGRESLPAVATVLVRGDCGIFVRDCDSKVVDIIWQMRGMGYTRVLKAKDYSRTPVEFLHHRPGGDRCGWRCR